MTTQHLRELLAKAGKYPKLEPVSDPVDRQYRCPLCAGEGTIDAEFVSKGTEEIEAGINTSLVGVQVYGIGDAMTAMEELVPLVIQALPALLDVVEQVEWFIKHGQPESAFDGQEWSEREANVLAALAKMDEVKL
jgi:hypothetical protein